MPLEETNFPGHRVQLRRSSRLQWCNRFSNTADDPINLEPTQESEINSNMEHDEQNTTPTRSEGIKQKRYKRVGRKKKKITAGKISTPDSDVYSSTVYFLAIIVQLLLPTLHMILIIIRMIILYSFAQESDEQTYSIQELYMAEYEAAHAQNQNEETEYAQQNQEQQNFGNQQQPPTEEDENLEEKDQLETQNKEHAEENQQSQSQEEAQNKDKSPTAKNKKWKRKKTEEVHN